MPPVSLAILLLLLAAVLVWLLGVAWAPRRSDRVADEEIDREVLAEAEEELQELDSSATPDDAEELPDWGPGAPR